MRDEAGRGVIVADIDGTLCFHEKLHGVRPAEASPEDGAASSPDAGLRSGAPTTAPHGSPPSPSPLPAVPVLDGPHATWAHDVSTRLYPSYVSVETRRLAHALREGFDWILVTGGRASTWQRRRDALDFADHVVLENGGRILDAAGEEDLEWSRSLEGHETLRAVADELRARGWVLDDEGRTSGLRLRAEDNPRRSTEAWADVERDLRTRPLSITRNLGHLDVLLPGLGKDRALARLLRQRPGHGPVHGLGDDLNDLPYLRRCDHAAVLNSSLPEVLEEARRRGWTVSRAPHFRGIEQLLADLLQGG